MYAPNPLTHLESAGTAWLFCSSCGVNCSANDPCPCDREPDAVPLVPSSSTPVPPGKPGKAKTSADDQGGVVSKEDGDGGTGGETHGR